MSCQGRYLEEVKDARYLEVTVSDDLEWTKHIDVITAKASSKLSFLRSNLKPAEGLSRKTKENRILLHSKVLPRIQHQKYNNDKLEMVQRRAAHFMEIRYRMYETESVKQILEQLTWIPPDKPCFSYGTC